MSRLVRKWFVRCLDRIMPRPTGRRRLGFDLLESRTTPATYTVTTPLDFPLNGSPPGQLSLRDAIREATLNPGPDTINFSPTIASTTVTLQGLGLDPDSELPIVNDIAIDGTVGAGRVTVRTTAGKRIFDVSGAGTDFDLTDIILNNGQTQVFGGGGAGVRVLGGVVRATRVDFVGNNSSNNGGGMAIGGGSVTLDTVVFDGNTASDSGGGLSMGSGSVSMTNVVFRNNFAANLGGGVALLSVSGTQTIDRALFEGNLASEGGAFYVNNSSLTLSNATIRANTGFIRGAGGAVNPGGQLRTSSVVFGGLNGSDGNNAPEGAALSNNGQTFLELTTIANNTSNANGGSLRVDGGNVDVVNSTISNNQGGAGIYIVGGTTRLTNATIAFNANFGVVNLSSLLSGNSIFSNNGLGSIFFGGVSSSGGNNIFSDAPSGTIGSDLINTNPLLLALAANGATNPSFTHAFQSNSPALNAGDNGKATGPFDQRLAPRISSGVVDIGAYELLDTIAPTATLATPPNITGASAGNATTTVIVTYADPVGTGLEVTSGVNPSTFGINDITVSNGATVTGFLPIGNTVFYTVQAPGGTWGASPQGTYTVNVVAGNVRDFALNGVPNSSTSFIVDTNGPTAVLTTPPATITATEGGNTTNNFTVTFTDTVSGINAATIGAGDFVATNGATTATVTVLSVISTPTSASVIYQVNAPGGTWDASPQGTYTIALVAGSVLDNFGNPVAGNPNFASFTVSTVRPFATMTTQPANITVANATPGTNSFTITYTTLGAPLNPATYGANDVTVTNGATTLTVISVANNMNAVTYIVQAPGGMWTNMPQGLYTIALNGNSVFDVTGNAVLANPTIGFFTVDAFRPTAAMPTPPPNITANHAGPQSNTFTINYADVGLGIDPTTLGIGNIAVTNGATVLTVATAMVGAPVAGVYPVTYTVLAPGGNWATAPTGAYTVSIVGNNVKDLAGNGINANHNFAFFVVDLTRPTAVLTTPPVNINAANAVPAPKTFAITYNDTGTGMNPATFIAGNVSVTNGAITIPVTGVSAAGNVVTYTITPPAAWGSVAAPNGTYTLALNASAADFAANTVLAVPALATFNVDVSAPTVVVSPTGTITNASPIVFTIDFSEPVSGLTTAGITVTNGTIASLTAVSTSQYTLNVTPTADGVVTVAVNAGAAQDAANNPNLASNVASVTSDRTGPTTTFGGPTPTDTATGPVVYTVTWTDVNFQSASLTKSQVILNRTGTANGTVSNVVVAGNMATITIINTYGNGTLSISLPAGVAVDTVGNGSAAAGPSAAVTIKGNRLLSLSQPAAPKTILPGATYLYAIDYGNLGNQISPNARVIVTLPAAGVFVASTSTTGWASIGGGKYQYSFNSLLQPGKIGRLVFAVTYPAKTLPGTVAKFTAIITDDLAGGAAVVTSSVTSTIVDPNRLRWQR